MSQTRLVLPTAVGRTRNQSFQSNQRATATELIRQLAANPWTLFACKSIIVSVSAFDIFLTIKYVESLPSLELNPLGRWLMNLDTDPNCELSQIAAFVTAKFTGNFLVLSILEWLCSWRRSWAAIVATAVAFCQLALLWFLIGG